MTPFLHRTAEYILNHFRDRLPEVAVVVPNRRAGLFLQRHLARLIGRTAWAPAVYPIEEFVRVLSGLREADHASCLVELYRVHREFEREKAQLFDEFLRWAPQLLSDFNEIDRHLTDPERLFGFLDEVRALTVWNLDKTPLTDFQKNYLRFYNSLVHLYRGLSGALLARGEGYPGLLFRQAWLRLEKGETELPGDHVVFAGFNALTAAEEKIFDFLVKQGIAHLLWDADSYYADDPEQEAGDSLRRWFRMWPEWSSYWKSDNLVTGKKEIHVIGAPDTAGQVKLAGVLLEELKTRGMLDEQTAVVLPDEGLLLPLLNSLPAGTGDVNITMGLPLVQTPLATLLLSICNMHLRAARLSGDRKNHVFHFRDMVRVMKHPCLSQLVSGLMPERESEFRELIAEIRSGRKIFLGIRDLLPGEPGLFHIDPGFLAMLFRGWESPVSAVSQLQELVNQFTMAIRREPVSPGAEPASPLETEHAYSIARILQRLRLLVSGSGDVFTLDSLAAFFRQLLASTRLPFYGEPLKGLQIMGMLETRTLDFGRVIILSCNEGLVPSGKQVNSFIPFDVRRDFHLPLLRHHDAVYAYHFYRLIQRAKEVWLMYCTEAGNLGSGDKSRFIRQLGAELAIRNPGVIFREEMLITPLARGEEKRAIEIPKEAPVMDKLMAKAASGFAPTALNAYRACSLRFYYSEIAGLKEPEAPEDEIDPRMLGSAVHAALKELFQPLAGKSLTREHLNALEPLVDGAVDQGFSKVMQHGGHASGKNRLLVETARIMIRNYIRREAETIEQSYGNGENLTIHLLEHFLSGILRLDVAGQSLGIRIKGIVDRIDRVGGITRIIDYKTGEVKNREVRIRQWDDLIINPDVDKAFQLIVYAWLYSLKNPGQMLNAGIISLKKQGSGLITAGFPAEEKSELSPDIGPDEVNKTAEILSRILGEVFDPAVPFRQTNDTDRCRRCPYASICGR